MHIITNCTRCKKDFMSHQMEVYLLREPILNIQIKKDYPIQDDVWESRRWNADRTESCDLSDWDVICHECDEIEKHGMLEKVLEENKIDILETLLLVVQQDHPEFNEPHTTGWDCLENAKKWLEELKQHESITKTK